jgi:tetratricopeptide (TPR) repeat protein
VASYDLLEQFDRLWMAAHGGDVRAMTELALLSDGHERKAWLRRASDQGAPWASELLAHEYIKEGQPETAVRWHQRAYENGERYAAEELAEVLLRLGRPGEAERWARLAAEGRQAPSAFRLLAEVLLRLDRLEEAERWARRAIEADLLSQGALQTLCEVLERQGKTSEAATERRRSIQLGDSFDLRLYGPLHPSELVSVAVVTAAVASFVNAVMIKAGDDSYAGGRAMLRWLFRRGQAKVSERRRPKSQLLIVEDPDPTLKLAISLGTDTPDKQLRALKDLDVDAVFNDAKRRKARAVHIRWHKPNQTWKPFDQ